MIRALIIFALTLTMVHEGLAAFTAVRTTSHAAVISSSSISK